jgi:enterobactin synthetase component D
VPSLQPARVLVELGPAVVSAGFVCDDHAGVIAELGPLVRQPSISASAVPKRRAEFLAGRFAARTALAALGIDATPGRDAEGRPLWPAGIVGSITHGAGRALCAVASSRDVLGVGIDVERLMDASVKDELLARICSEPERAMLARLAAPEAASITFAFSAKESLYKCLFPHVGRFMDFNAAAVVDAQAVAVPGGFTGELVLELTVDWASSLPRGLRFTAPFVSSERHVETGVTLRP